MRKEYQRSCILLTVTPQHSRVRSRRESNNGIHARWLGEVDEKLGEVDAHHIWARQWKVDFYRFDFRVSMLAWVGRFSQIRSFHAPLSCADTLFRPSKFKSWFVISEKVHVEKMGFPHLPWPPAPSLELWLHTVFFVENCLGLGATSSRINRPQIGFVTVVRRPLTNRRNIVGFPFCIRKIHWVPLYDDHENGCPRLNCLPKINFQIHQKRHSSRVEVIAVFTKF
jgi:hypothetical protein